MKTFFIISLILTGFLLNCNPDNKSEPILQDKTKSVLSDNIKIEVYNLLEIKAYKLGYLMGRLEAIDDNKYTIEDLEGSTLWFIQSIGLGPEYYIYAKED